MSDVMVDIPGAKGMEDTLTFADIRNLVGVDYLSTGEPGLDLVHKIAQPFDLRSPVDEDLSLSKLVSDRFAPTFEPPRKREVPFQKIPRRSTPRKIGASQRYCAKN